MTAVVWSFLALFLVLQLEAQGQTEPKELTPALGRGRQLLMPCVADTAIYAPKHPNRTDDIYKANYGHAKTVPFHGIHYNQMARDSAYFLLLDFDAAEARGWTIESGTLYFHQADGSKKLRTVSVSTVATPWKEGAGTGKEPEKQGGGATVNWAVYEERRWAGFQSELIDATFELGHTLTHTIEIRQMQEGWSAIDLPTSLLHALVNGGSSGLALLEEKGQTEIVHHIHTRESAFPPYLVVNLKARANQPPPAPIQLNVTPAPESASLESGAVRVSMWVTASTARINVIYWLMGGATNTLERWRTPWPPDKGAEISFVLDRLPPEREVGVAVRAVGIGGSRSNLATRLGTTSSAKPLPRKLTAQLPVQFQAEPQIHAGKIRVWAYGESEKAHPVSGNLLEEVGRERYGGEPAGDYRRGNLYWNGRDGAVTLAGCRNEIVAFQLLVEAVEGELQDVSVQVGSLLGPGDLPIIQVPEKNIWVFREWYVRDGEWMGELCLPLEASQTFQIPDPHNQVPGQRNQSLVVDIHIPHEIAPGRYRGFLTIKAKEVNRFQIPLELTVWPPVLPDTLSFNCELNAYSNLANTHAHHRLAHAHRTTLNVLPYSQRGRIKWNFKLPLVGTNKDTRVADWTAFDEHFGPLYDGSAFKDLPRAGVPVVNQYLPIHENWPLLFRSYYNFQPIQDTYPADIREHGLKAASIEQNMNKIYSAGFKAVVRDFVRHYREKGWTQTQFQFFLNNKRGEGKPSFWNLDEPQHRDDWLALRYWGRLFKSVNADAQGVRFLFRGDISRPQWQRHWLDRLVDQMYIGPKAFFAKNERCREMMQRGMTFYHFGSLNPPSISNMDATVWPLQAYLAGVDGVASSNSLGGSENYQDPSETAILLPPPPEAPTQEPVCSIRLKALRRGQQDVEYLALLAREQGYDREQIAGLVADLLELHSETSGRFVDEAGDSLFSNLNSEQLARIRAAVAARLSE